MKKRKQLSRLTNRIHEHASHALAEWNSTRASELMDDVWRLIFVLDRTKAKSEKGAQP